MKYYNKDGEPITVDTWRDLYRNKRYSTVAETRSEIIKVDTSWVGVQTCRERIADLFLTRTIDIKLSSNRDVRTHLPDVWTSTITEAKLAHSERCRKVGLRAALT